MLICDKEKHQRKLIDAITQGSEKIACCINRRGEEIVILPYAKTSDLNSSTGYNKKNLVTVVQSCVGKADMPYDLLFLRHRFPSIFRIGELDVDNEVRAYNMICRWGADDVFYKVDELVDVIVKGLEDQGDS